MAKVEIVNNERVILVEQKVIEQRVMLDLSMDEAKVLRFLLDYVGGCPRNSPRKFTDGIYNALNAAKIYKYNGYQLDSPVSLYFKEYSNG